MTEIAGIDPSVPPSGTGCMWVSRRFHDDTRPLNIVR